MSDTKAPPPAAAAPKPAAPAAPPPPAVPGMVTLSVDGQTVSVPPGSTIIQATNKCGTHVPHFCYHPGLPVVGQCRMCFVEVEGMPKLATACSQPASEGMKVQTASEKVKAGQNGTLEFILLNHPLDCPICDRGGECKLQDYTYEYGPPESRMIDDKVLRDKHRAISDEVVLDQERCILCTRCVRFSSDVDGLSELVVNERGNASNIDIFEGRPLKSNFSGNVVDLCPVGALTATDFRFAARPWELRKHEGVCTGCGVGCNVELHTKHRHPGIPRPDKHDPVPELVRLMPRENMNVNTWWMCDKGRWGYHFHNDETARLRAPSLRAGAGAVAAPVSFREVQAAIEQASQSHGGGWDFWIDDTVPHEGIAWIKELATSWASRGRKTGPINDHPFAKEVLTFWAGRMASPWTSGAADWTGIKRVVAPMSVRDLEHVAPILALRLGQAVRKGTLAWDVKSPAEFSGANAETAFLAMPPKSSADLAALAKLPTDAKLVVLFANANSRGLLNEGIVPVEILEDALAKTSPQRPVFVVSQRTQNATSKALVSLVSKAPFAVVADSFSSSLTDAARAVLPLTPLYESEATMTNIENRRQKVSGIQIHHPNQPSIERGAPLVAASLRLV